MWTNVALAQTPSCSPPTGEKGTKEARPGQATPHCSEGLCIQVQHWSSHIVLDHTSAPFSEINWAWVALNQSRLSAAAAAASTLSRAKERDCGSYWSQRRRTGPPIPPSSPFLVSSGPGPSFRWGEQFQESESWVSSWVSTPHPHPALCAGSENKAPQWPGIWWLQISLDLLGWEEEVWGGVRRVGGGVER